MVVVAISRVALWVLRFWCFRDSYVKTRVDVVSHTTVHPDWLKALDASLVINLAGAPVRARVCV